jgi:hypothetical protein
LLVKIIGKGIGTIFLLSLEYSIYDEANKVVIAVRDFITSKVNDDEYGLFLLGSLAHGDFSPLVSDIDLLLILDTNRIHTDENFFANLVQYIQRQDELSMGGRLSLFSAYYDKTDKLIDSVRFPIVDQLDYLSSQVRFSGQLRVLPWEKPSKNDLLRGSISFIKDKILTPENLFYLENPRILYGRDYTWLTKLILFPARFIYTAETGCVGSNWSAVEYYSHSRGKTISSSLVMSAHKWRSLRMHIDETEMIIKSGFRHLYSELIDIFSGELVNEGCFDPDDYKMFRP